MKLHKDDPKAARMGVFDAAGQQLPFVISYDTETKEVEMLIRIKDDEGLADGERRCHLILTEDFKPFRAKFILPGSYAMDMDGNKIE